MQAGDATPFADEIRNAIRDYDEQIKDLQRTLESGDGGDNDEVRQLLKALCDAKQDAQDALTQLATTQEDDAQELREERPAKKPRVEDDGVGPTTVPIPETPGFELLPDRPGGAVQRERPGTSSGAPHPRNKYAVTEPDFGRLSDEYPSLKSFLKEFPADGGKSKGAAGGAKAGKGGVSLDFRDPGTTRELTRVLLKADFGVNWWVPDGQLVPPLTNRANYVHWIEDLLELSRPEGQVRGLDIGTGANCIYALLGAALCGWHMVGADVTEEAAAAAARNVAANPDLRNLLEIRHVMPPPGVSHGSVRFSPAAPRVQPSQLPEHAEDLVALEVATAAGAKGGKKPNADQAKKWLSGGVLLPAMREGETFAFSMCNPPFFGTESEAKQGKSDYAGTAAEMVCPGGEERFCRRMVADSFALRDRVHWFTTMVGKKSTMKDLRQLLHALKIPVVRTTEFFQGRTQRWGIAWSFTAPRDKALGPLRQGAYHSTGSGFFAQGSKDDQTHAVPTQRASWTVVAAAGSGPDLAVKRLERDVKGMGFAQVGPGTAPFSLAVSGVRQGGGGSIVFKVSVFESPGGRKGALDEKEWLVSAELDNDLKGDLAACVEFTRAMHELEQISKATR